MLLDGKVLHFTAYDAASVLTAVANQHGGLSPTGQITAVLADGRKVVVQHKEGTCPSNVE